MGLPALHNESGLSPSHKSHCWIQLVVSLLRTWSGCSFKGLWLRHNYLDPFQLGFLFEHDTKATLITFGDDLWDNQNEIGVSILLIWWHLIKYPSEPPQGFGNGGHGIERENSSLRPLFCGISQGSVLLPLLFPDCWVRSYTSTDVDDSCISPLQAFL